MPQFTTKPPFGSSHDHFHTVSVYIQHQKKIKARQYNFVLSFMWSYMYIAYLKLSPPVRSINARQGPLGVLANAELTLTFGLLFVFMTYLKSKYRAGASLHPFCLSKQIKVMSCINVHHRTVFDPRYIPPSHTNRKSLTIPLSILGIP